MEMMLSACSGRVMAFPLRSVVMSTSVSAPAAQQTDAAESMHPIRIIASLFFIICLLTVGSDLLRIFRNKNSRSE